MTRLITRYRSFLRWVGRRFASTIQNEQVRYLLDPHRQVNGPGSHITLGHRSYFNGPPRVHVYDSYVYRSNVHIGRYCSLADDIEFLLGGNHHPEWVSTFPHHASTDEVTGRGDIEIGNNVWIGRGAVIFSGVRIGDGAIVGARSVITKDVDPFMIVAGVPARPIRLRFDEHMVERLRKIEWWNWPDEEVDRFAPLLQSGDIGRFIDEAERRS